MESRGFIVAAWEDRREPGAGGRAGGSSSRVLITGRLEDARSFAAIISAARPALYVALADGAAALAALERVALDAGNGRASGEHGAALERDQAQLDSAPWSDLAGTPLARLVLPHGASERAARMLDAAGIRLVAQERPRAADTLSALGISGPVAINGVAQPGRRVAAVFVEPELSPCRTRAALAWMALDIETDRGGAVVAVSLAGAGGPGEVLLLGPVLAAPFVTSFASEAALLAELARRIVARDPDVITGWNVLDFDLDVLLKRFAAHAIPFDAGRTGEVVARVGGQKALRVPGRAVLDAMRLVRASGERFEDLSLESVSQSLLGEGKSTAAKGEAKLRELDRLRAEEPEAFCAYCLRDSELVLRILAKTGLDVLTAKRCALTGVPLELAWTSIPAFERIYGAQLRARHVLPPEREERRVSGAAGGTVLEAIPGIFSNVLVFDFRSLYPSIIRTFNIDPLSHARAEARPAIPDDIVAPNGARFERDSRHPAGHHHPLCGRARGGDRRGRRDRRLCLQDLAELILWSARRRRMPLRAHRTGRRHHLVREDVPHRRARLLRAARDAASCTEIPTRCSCCPASATIGPRRAHLVWRGLARRSSMPGSPPPSSSTTAFPPRCASAARRPTGASSFRASAPTPPAAGAAAPRDMPDSSSARPARRRWR